MKKKILVWDDDNEDLFSLFAISCHQKDYRLCWELNKTLELNLQKEDDIIVPNSEFSFSRYYFDREDFMQEYYLLSNKSGNQYLAPELKQADYFLQVYGLRSEIESDDIIQKIISIDIVLTAYTFDAAKLKNGHPLFYTAISRNKEENKTDLLAPFRIKNSP